MNSERSGQTFLNDHLSKIQEKNPSYSLRAFSRDLDIDKTTLSDYLSGSRPISKNNINKCREYFHLEDHYVDFLMNEYEEKRNRTKSNLDYTKIENDDLKLFNNWQNIAVLTMCDIQNQTSDKESIAKKSGIPEKEIEESLDFLLKNKHILIINNKLVSLHKKITTSNNRPSAHLKKFHTDSLDRAKMAVKNVSIEERYFTTVNLISSRQKIKEAKVMIHHFQRQLVKFLESEENEKKEELLSLGIQLYPTNCLSEEPLEIH